MSGVAAKSRRRDAEQTRRALLEAAGALFDERGYDRATIREIGERAGVDPALIARYFGSKEALYLAVLADEERLARREPVAADLRVVAERLLRRWDTAGGAPVRRALADPEPPSAQERAQLRRILRPGVLDPARSALAAAGDAPDDDAELRAQLLLALLVGVSVTRSNGTLPALAGASRAELLRQLEPLLDALEAGPDAGASGRRGAPTGRRLSSSRSA